MLEIKQSDRFKIFVAIMIVLSLCFLGLFIYANTIDDKEFVLKQGYDESDFTFGFYEAKEWSDYGSGYAHGYEYDGAIDNKTPYNLTDWVIEMELSDGCKIDSQWNGDFNRVGNQLTITPMDYNEIVEANTSQTFGFVLLTDVEDNILDCKFKYHIAPKFYQLPAFVPLFLLTLFVVFSFLSEILTAIRTSRLIIQHNEQRNIINQSFLTFANMIDAKDSYTKGHSYRVAVYSRELSKRMGFSMEEQERVFYVALLHDIGKIGVTDAILKKTAKLTYDEFNEIKEHVSMGGDILKNFNAINDIEKGARYHHERYDGSGYMSGLAGENIPLIARIICVADAFDAMSSARCYRAALDMEHIIDELKQHSGSQFDPKIVPHMLDMIKSGKAPIDKDVDALEYELK